MKLRQIVENDLAPTTQNQMAATSSQLSQQPQVDQERRRRFDQTRQAVSKLEDQYDDFQDELEKQIDLDAEAVQDKQQLATQSQSLQQAQGQLNAQMLS